MMKRFLPFIAFAAAVSLFSCKRESDNIYGPDGTRGYYPLSKGHYIVYDVDSTIYNDFTGDSVHHRSVVRYTVTDTFRDNRNFLSYQVDVVAKPNDTSAFQTNDVFFVTPGVNSIDVVQGNLRFTKLVFPVVNDYAFNGNSQIATNDQDLVWYANWSYKYSKVGQPYNNGLADFSNTVIVEEKNDSLNNPLTMPTTYAERTYAREIYAHNVGLIQREMTRWTYDQNPTTGNYAKKGWDVLMRAKDHN